MDVIELTRSLVEIPSVTGEERLAGEFLFDFLQDQGWICDRQEVAADRFNVVARRGRPEIILSTHMDTVPPFFGFREDEEFIYGRGVCDAKGIIATMICAAQELVAEGETDLGLLFVVGEETDSAGAKKARDLDLDCSFVIDGEPTDNELVVGHKGDALRPHQDHWRHGSFRLPRNRGSQPSTSCWTYWRGSAHWSFHMTPVWERPM